LLTIVRTMGIVFAETVPFVVIRVVRGPVAQAKKSSSDAWLNVLLISSQNSLTATIASVLPPRSG